MDRQAKAIGWEGDRRVGQSPPSEWPAPPHSLHQPALHGKRPVNFIGWLFCCEACTGRIVCSCLLQGLCRSDRLPAVFACNGLVLQAVFACPPLLSMPAALIIVCPRSILHCPLVHDHVRQDRRASCKDCPVGSYNTGLQWRPVRRLTFAFFLQSSLILGHGLV